MKCQYCLYFRQIPQGAGYCERRKEIIVFPQMYENCEYYVPKNIFAEDFLDRALSETIRKKANVTIFDKISSTIKKIFRK